MTSALLEPESGEASPEHVEDPPIRVDPHEHVRHRDELELGGLGVREVHFGFPDVFHKVGVVQVQGLGDVRVAEPLVRPLLPQVQVHLIVLREDRRETVVSAHLLI